ncbi:hypothetical protein [Tolypothrix sp. VBCCA 56010]|uniref:hypothetical protein n=1 Tax=Tolypothrix sp. VBCCA 56010 TaxID=3137731 RepID=UPI003D7EF93C
MIVLSAFPHLKVQLDFLLFAFGGRVGDRTQAEFLTTHAIASGGRVRHRTFM